MTRFLKTPLVLLAVIAAIALLSCTQEGGSPAPSPSEVPYDPKLPLVLEYGRGSCPWCVKMEPILADLRREYAGRLNVAEVNIDRQRDLADRAGIRVLPTIIIYKPGGEEVHRHQGYWPKEEMVPKLKELGMVS